jgi:hypothetical protein
MGTLIELPNLQKPEFPQRKSSFNTAKSQPLTHLQSKKESNQEILMDKISKKEPIRKTMKRNKTTPNLHKGLNKINLQKKILKIEVPQKNEIVKMDPESSFLIEPQEMQPIESDISSEFERLPSPSSERSYMPPKNKQVSNNDKQDKAMELNKMINQTVKKNNKEKEANKDLELEKKDSYPLPKNPEFIPKVDFERTNQRSVFNNPMSINSGFNRRGMSEISAIHPQQNYFRNSIVDFPQSQFGFNMNTSFTVKDQNHFPPIVKIFF